MNALGKKKQKGIENQGHASDREMYSLEKVAKGAKQLALSSDEVHVEK